MSLRTAANDSTSYYMLGYYLDRSGGREGWRDLQVKVRRNGADVRARNGFFVSDETSPEKAVKRDIQMALNSPLEYTGIPLMVHWSRAVPLRGSDKVRVEFDIVLPKGSFSIDGSDGNHCRLEIVAIAKKPDGSSAADVSDTLEAHISPQELPRYIQKGMAYRKSFDVPMGDYTVRFVVRDDMSGKIGSVEAPLKLEMAAISADTKKDTVELKSGSK